MKATFWFEVNWDIHSDRFHQLVWLQWQRQDWQFDRNVNILIYRNEYEFGGWSKCEPHLESWSSWTLWFSAPILSASSLVDSSSSKADSILTLKIILYYICILLIYKPGMWFQKSYLEIFKVKTLPSFLITGLLYWFLQKIWNNIHGYCI